MSQCYHDEGPPAVGRKVMLAVPTYASPDAGCCFSLARSREALARAGIDSALLILEGNCHVDDARNEIVREFLASDCTDLVFLDADVVWEPRALTRLCLHDLDIVGGVYPFRREGGENMPVRLKPGGETGKGLRQVLGLPTGFMKIARPVLERMAETAPKFQTRNGLAALIFDRPPPGKDMLRWGGDIDFCNRWLAMGGTIWADEELMLGHATKTILRDSLAAWLRRNTGTTLAHVAPKIRAGTECHDDYAELFRMAGNPFAADADALLFVTGLARKCTGPIVETGSGLSSITMALATDQQVYSLEHIGHYAAQTHQWADEAGVQNLNIGLAPLAGDLWYDLAAFDLPEKFALGFCDGPPRLYGTRMRFFEELGERCTVIVADDMNTSGDYAREVRQWAAGHDRRVAEYGRVALIVRNSKMGVLE